MVAPKAPRRPRFNSILTNISKSRFESVHRFERQFGNTIRDYDRDFGPGSLVLVRNSSIENDAGRKAKPHCMGPHGRPAPHAKCPLQYHARSRSSIPTAAEPTSASLTEDSILHFLASASPKPHLVSHIVSGLIRHAFSILVAAPPSPAGILLSFPLGTTSSCTRANFP